MSKCAIAEPFWSLSLVWYFECQNINEISSRVTKWIIASETIRSFKDKHNHHSVRFREDWNRCWSVVNVDNRRKRTRGLPIPFVLLLDKKQHGTAGDTQLLFVLVAPCWLREAVLASSEENEMLPDVQGINLWQKVDLLAKLGRWCTRSIERTLTTVMFYF